MISHWVKWNAFFTALFEFSITFKVSCRSVLLCSFHFMLAPEFIYWIRLYVGCFDICYVAEFDIWW